MDTGSQESSQPQNRLPWLFFALTFAISWIIWLPLLLFPRNADQLQPLVYVGAFGPWLAAAILTWRTEGRSGIGRWLRRIFHWRINIIWYLMGALILPVGGALLHFGLYLLFGGQADFAEAPAWLLFIPAMLTTALLGGGQEEPGWRGFALPKLLKQTHPILASLIIAPFWVLWHLPLNLTTAWGGGNSLIGMFFYIFPLSVIMTWLTLKSGGSVLPAMLFHGGGNVYSAWFPMETLVMGSVVVDFDILKAMSYGTIAIVVILATKGQLGLKSRG